jgi:hypothetical protein
MVGDYEGLAGAGRTFRPLFMTTNTGQPGNSTDIYTAEPHATGQVTTAAVQAYSLLNPHSLTRR